MSSEHVFAIDPGGRSGWASALMDTDRLELTGGGVLRQDHMADWLAAKQGVLYMGPRQPQPDPPARSNLYGPGLANRAYDVVIYESWYPRMQNGSMAWIEHDPLLSAQHVGQVRWIALASGARLVTQHPSDKPTALASMPQALLALDVYSNEQHDKDARMHLWLYFFRNWFTGKVDPERTVIA